jgi:hypothetical protein
VIFDKEEGADAIASAERERERERERDKARHILTEGTI